MSIRRGNRKILVVFFSLSILLFSMPSSLGTQPMEMVPRGNLVLPAGERATIVIDYSHGQESGVAEVIDGDALLGAELEAMNYRVIWARGGLNSSILSGADGLLLSPIMGITNGFLLSEITAISDWFNSGSKFLWVGCDSDYYSPPDLGQFINDNMSLVLEAVESHVYPEPATIEDPESHVGAAYRVVANQTGDDPFISSIVRDVETVLMHSPTTVYGSNNDANPGVGIDPVALENTTINNVYPLIYYSEFAFLYDADLIAPIAHGDGEIGGFVAATLEMNAGSSDEGVLVVSGASPYGYYRPMNFDEYLGTTLNGSLFVLQAIDFGMKQVLPELGVIVIDYSHGQESSTQSVLDDDALLGANLEAMGYTVVWARGGLNSSLLTDVDGLLIASIVGDTNGFLASEITAISDWFNSGSKFLWVGCDSDYISSISGQFINDNMSLVLEAVGSHVYPEPTTIEDQESCVNIGYRVIANQTSDDAFVSDIVSDVETVLMHDPTLVYGSNNEDNPGVGVDPVALENTTIDDVYPLLYYSDFATIIDRDLTPPIAHEDGADGAFVAATLEINAGTSGNGTIITSGSSPYADYRSMHFDDYFASFNGSIFVEQAIEFCMKYLKPMPIVNDAPDVMYEEGRMGNYINWNPNSTIPKSYAITLEGSLVREGPWNTTNEVISVNVDNLLEGEYNYTLTVTDNWNREASDSVIVTVMVNEAPMVNHPVNITYTLGDTNNIIEWELSDTSLKNYSVYRNCLLLYSSANFNSDEPVNIFVVYPVDGYEVGLYNLTIFVTDWLDQYSSDTVWVEVLPESTTTTTTTTTPTTTTTTTTTSTNSSTTSTGDDTGLGNVIIMISIGSIVIIVIVIVLIKRKA